MLSMAKTKGLVTLPSEKNFIKETLELIDRWGADAIRDSDGTELDKEIKELSNMKIYTKYFVSRGHNDFAAKHINEAIQIYLMSEFSTATTNELTIHFMEKYFKEQINPDYDHDPKKYWEVVDRTTGEVVDVKKWTVNKETHSVTIRDVSIWHEYTVSFLAYMIWDPTQMYNYVTNNWKSVPKHIPFDIRQPASNKFIKERFEQWLAENPDTDVVRFTTFFYHFTLIFNQLGKEKFVDWFGYGATVSVSALIEFEKQKGYRLRPEDFVDEGYYNSSFRIPSKAYKDYIDFVSAFVAKEAKELVELAHENGKEAMMFLGDTWIGTEPYGKYFEQIGLDAVVGSVGSGATLRMISDIPHVKYTEGRFLPYFFPDVFREGNNPVIEANENWLKARRAIMRNPVDRIGYGGYLSLAYKFPEFVDYVEKVTDEFREIYHNIKNVKPYTGLKVAIVNAWGKLRTWQTHMVAHDIWYKEIYSYLGVLEALSGASVDVEFISFDDIITNCIPNDIDVIINAGNSGTAFSGGIIWKNETLVSTIRQWIFNGGGFVGIGEPTACLHQGRYFQLAGALGVDKELGFSLSTDKYFTTEVENHFILEDNEEFDFGESMNNIYALTEETEILEYSNNEVHLASHSFGNGRTIYIAGLPYSEANTRLLMRSLYFAANKEYEFNKWRAENVFVEVHVYPEVAKYAIVNNSNKKQRTSVYLGDGSIIEVELKPSEIIWRDY